MNTTKLNIGSYDNRGYVVDEGNFIRRIVNEDYWGKAQETYDAYLRHDLVNWGIVNTQIDIDSHSFIHEKHIISYPFEWPAAMYKDAVLFHLELLIKLSEIGLTLKDGLPTNILFENSNPVFVDFLSLLKTADLKNEEWLGKSIKFNDKRFSVIEKTLIPYMIIPLLAMSQKRFDLARKMLSTRACNMGQNAPQIHEVFEVTVYRSNFFSKEFIKSLCRKLLSIKDYLYAKYIFSFRKYLIIPHRRNNLFVNYIKRLHKYVLNLDVDPYPGDYDNYYSAKNEDFNFDDSRTWKNKQKNVFGILKSKNIKNVIDLGANTGWFSCLSEKLGAQVFSFDIEESCLNKLYNNVKTSGKRILVLKVPFDNLFENHFGLDLSTSEREYKNRNFKENPLFIEPIKRFKCDVVLCLGLIHHLILGMDYKMEFVLNILSKLSKRYVLVEFIDIDDPLIVTSTGDFFMNIDKHNKDTYNIDLFMREARKSFKYIEIKSSQPKTRRLVLLEK